MAEPEEERAEAVAACRSEETEELRRRLAVMEDQKTDLEYAVWKMEMERADDRSRAEGMVRFDCIIIYLPLIPLEQKIGTIIHLFAAYFWRVGRRSGYYLLTVVSL